MLFAALWFSELAYAQDNPDSADPEPVIEVKAQGPTDDDIQQRISRIFSQIETLAGVSALVEEGVVTLAGTVSNERYAERAHDLAIRIEGVVTVEDQISRTLDVEGNVRPIISQLRSDIEQWVKALPLVLLAIVVFCVIAFIGHLFANWSAFWRRLAPNGFLAELMAQAVRIVALVFALVTALNLVGATALMGTILGGAGVLGLAIGFAVRDTLENYISSIMLSLRQPFRANDHVLINEHEGKVERLTSRATVLMTLDGNQLRIPNSTVFKGVILNYTRNPQRRFSFKLGVDANDDPVAAMKTGLDALETLDFILDSPAPNAVISEVGDSNIVILFLAWVNQEQSDFGKARSLSIRAAKAALETCGFTLPEPIYRLRFDGTIPPVDARQPESTATESALPRAADRPAITADPAEIMDVKPDTHIEDMMNEERVHDDSVDLLDDNRPTE